VIALWMLALAQTEPMPAPLVDGTFRAIVGTVLVLGTLALLAYLLRRGVVTLPGQRASKAVSVETALSLGDRRSVAILNVEGRRLLVGMTQAQITLLTDLGTAKAAFDQALSRATTATPVKPT
jgi:flagellar biosynthetic protein FliO